MIDAVLHRQVEQAKAELETLLAAETFSADQLLEKADTLQTLLAIDSPSITSEEYQAFLHENLQWLALTIEKVTTAKDQLGVDLMQLAKRRKADKIYGENI